MKNRTNRTLTAVLAAPMCLSPLLGSCGGKGEGSESGSTGGSSGKAFGSDSKIGIITEMCYAASKGIHSANPDAVAVFPGILTYAGSDDAKKLLKKVCRSIGSGQYGNGSTDPDDYFGAVALQCRAERTTKRLRR